MAGTIAPSETPLSFRASLPPYAQAWCWLPMVTGTLTLGLPHGKATVFHVWRCPQRRTLAHNVAEVRT